jgi:hypothetical protein
MFNSKTLCAVSWTYSSSATALQAFVYLKCKQPRNKSQLCAPLITANGIELSCASLKPSQQLHALDV